MLYVCKACGFTYGDRKWAGKCESFCTEHGACSLEIAGHEIKTEVVIVQITDYT